MHILQDCLLFLLLRLFEQGNGTAAGDAGSSLDTDGSAASVPRSSLRGLQRGVSSPWWPASSGEWVSVS